MNGWIEDDWVEIREAAHLWGKKTAEVVKLLKAELENRCICVAQCGLAGRKEPSTRC